MSAASSWITSGAWLPANWVTSLSCTEFGSTFWYSTWMSGLAAFHVSTMFCVALTVRSWNAYEEKVIDTFSPGAAVCGAPPPEPPPLPVMQPDVSSTAEVTVAMDSVVSRRFTAFLSLRRNRIQPLTAPDSTPDTSLRWMIEKMMRLGRVAMRAVAARGPWLTGPSARTYRA